MRATNDRYGVARRYWERLQAASTDENGVFPLGECGSAEVLYRQYEEVRHIVRLAPFRSDTDVLELGSGNGRWALALAPSVRSYTAVDFSRSMVDLARARVQERGLDNVTFCESAAQDYAPTRSFDVIYLSGVSQYIEHDDLLRLLGRLASCLKPGGVLIDRTTIHLERRTVVDDGAYFSIYRTRDELVELYRQTGWGLSYSNPSYRYLNFPEAIKRQLRRRRSFWLVRATAPISFHLLRASARLSDRVREPAGAMAGFSHDFFVFRRA